MRYLVLACLSTLGACASSPRASSSTPSSTPSSTVGGVQAPLTRLRDRDRPTLAIKGDTAACAAPSVQFVDVKNPSPREVALAVHTPQGLAKLSADNLLRPFEKKRYEFAASQRLTGVSAWVFDQAHGVGRNADAMIDVEPKRSCGLP
jgi:hypothetical protein